MKFSFFRLWFGSKDTRRANRQEENVKPGYKRLPPTLKELDESYRALIRELGKR